MQNLEIFIQFILIMHCKLYNYTHWNDFHVSRSHTQRFWDGRYRKLMKNGGEMRKFFDDDCEMDFFLFRALKKSVKLVIKNFS